MCLFSKHCNQNVFSGILCESMLGFPFMGGSTFACIPPMSSKAHLQLFTGDDVGTVFETTADQAKEETQCQVHPSTKQEIGWEQWSKWPRKKHCDESGQRQQLAIKDTMVTKDDMAVSPCRMPFLHSESEGSGQADGRGKEHWAGCGIGTCPTWQQSC